MPNRHINEKVLTSPLLRLGELDVTLGAYTRHVSEEPPTSFSGARATAKHGVRQAAGFLLRASLPVKTCSKQSPAA